MIFKGFTYVAKKFEPKIGSFYAILGAMIWGSVMDQWRAHKTFISLLDVNVLLMEGQSNLKSTKSHIQSIKWTNN